MQVQAVAHWLDNAIRYDDSGFLPLMLGKHAIGYVNAVWRSRLQQANPSLFSVQADQVVLLAEGQDYATCSALLQQAAEGWRDRGWLDGWRNERFVAFLPAANPVSSWSAQRSARLALPAAPFTLTALAACPMAKSACGLVAVARSRMSPPTGWIT